MNCINFYSCIGYTLCFLHLFSIRGYYTNFFVLPFFSHWWLENLFKDYIQFSLIIPYFIIGRRQRQSHQLVILIVKVPETGYRDLSLMNGEIIAASINASITIPPPSATKESEQFYDSPTFFKQKASELIIQYND